MLFWFSPFILILNLRSLSGKSVYLVAATLRPETMYGQTNCWVHPRMKYIAFETKSNEVFICTERAATNMAYQLFTKDFGKFDILMNIEGKDVDHWITTKSSIDLI